MHPSPHPPPTPNPHYPPHIIPYVPPMHPPDVPLAREWMDYDAKLKESVSVMELEWKFEVHREKK